MKDVIIIGCGVTGAACAYELSRYKLDIAVLEADNDVANGTTKANSAIIHAGYDPKPGSLMAALNVRGNERTAEICDKLDVPFKRIGSLVAAFNENDRKMIEELYDRGVQNGVPDMRLLSADEVAAMEPELSKEVVGALYAPSAGIINPWEYCLAMAETAVKNGVELHRNSPVTAIERKGDGFVITAGGKEFETKYIVSAAGVYADKIHAMLAPCDYEIKPNRGEYYLLDKSEGGRVSHVIFQCPDENGKGVLVSPTVHGNLIVGPNAESSAADDVSTTAPAMAFIRKQSVKSVPGINFRENIRNFAGIRAKTAQDDFILREAVPHFIEAAGICSPGLSSAPAIAEYIVELLKKAGLTAEPKEEYDDSRRRIRFKELDAAERNSLIAENPAYGRVICRCETITEGEIIEACHTPIPACSVNGVKRRTGAGMGRCQGGFCGPRVQEILARELNISPVDVPMDSEGTYVLIGETKGGSAK